MHISSDPTFKINNVSNESIAKATGKTWPEWILILDDAKMFEHTHKEIADYVYDHLLKDGWWAQMVTVGYELAKGMRKQHQMVDGYSVSASKTLPVSLDVLYNAVADNNKRTHWLTNPIEISSKTENKYVNAAWEDGSRLAIGFYAKSDNKSQIALAHNKLKSETEAEHYKAFWHEKLQALAQYLSK